MERERRGERGVGKEGEEKRCGEREKGSRERGIGKEMWRERNS